MDFGEFIYHRLQKETRPIVIYGTGNGAEKLIHHLDKYGIPVSGIFVSDDFARERNFCGHKVKTFSSLESELGELVVLLGFATDRPELLLKIKELSEKVGGRLYVPEVPVFGNDIFTPQRLDGRAEDIKKLYNLLADEQSRRTLLGLLKFKISGIPQELYNVETSRAEAYKSIICPKKGDVFVDAGAYNGDTVEEFIKYCPNFGGIYAIEPAPVNFRKLKENPRISGKPYIKLINCAVSEEKGSATFSEKGGRNPYITQGGKIGVNVDALDNLIADKPSIIKLDVEGAEEKAIMGAETLIKSYSPKLMVSVYHKTEDFIDIPLLINKLQPNYRLYLRHHPYLPSWETNLYAVSK